MKTILNKERIIHATGFELIAILLFTPLMAWALNAEVATTGALTVMMSLLAMLWNMVYNGLIDRYRTTERQHWRFRVRLLHGVAFEVGLVVLCLPLAAWMLDLTLLQAFFVELAFFVFILPYTVLYNWGFDKAWGRWQSKTKPAAAVV
ncbi:multidrug/biocide efflux PACE transporter [Thalassolituus hydrocarboniclasticus]|uniref:Multidrug/biocide efflux PACE transporter n=1 Tax=Thalassolituus hydrocarboniclasticus TaxID=2742796 RepID=A0ABY6AFG7_9GAMM|nr:multidrug/biocide efflux PACE transporter [Thalassolituus hydrocarboniclasticus]UXD88598.1 multidrug/biocide efflux PACE transporter [Thalassolituus hydrocarboniclasticus]